MHRAHPIERRALMHEWIRQVLRDRREDAGLTLAQVEQVAGVDRGNLSRMERGLSRAVRDFDGIVEGYAKALGVEAVELWAEALARWQSDLKRRALKRPRKRSPRTRSA